MLEDIWDSRFNADDEIGEKGLVNLLRVYAEKNTEESLETAQRLLDLLDLQGNGMLQREDFTADATCALHGWCCRRVLCAGLRHALCFVHSLFLPPTPPSAGVAASSGMDIKPFFERALRTSHAPLTHLHTSPHTHTHTAHTSHLVKAWR